MIEELGKKQMEDLLVTNKDFTTSFPSPHSSHFP